MEDRLFFRDSYKTGLHKSIYRLSYIVFVMSIIINVIVLCAINVDIPTKFIIGIVLCIFFSIISIILFCKIFRYKRLYFDYYYNNASIVRSDPLLGNAFTITILFEYIYLCILSALLMAIPDSGIVTFIIGVFIASVLILTEIVIIHKNKNEEYSLIIKSNNELYILKDCMINLRTNGEVISKEELKKDDNISEIAKKYLEVLNKFLLSDNKDKVYIVDNHKYEIIHLKNPNTKKKTDTFIYIQYEESNKTKGIKIVNAYPNLLSELKKKM